MNTTIRAFVLLLVACGSCISIYAQSDRYRVDIDLQRVTDDRINVMIWPPSINADTATIVFPVTVPGTYEEHFWWRLVHNLRAYDETNLPMQVDRSLDSQFVVRNARKLRYITYELEDSFDDTTGKVQIFAPAGTGWEADSIFVINHGGAIPYIDGMQKHEYKVAVRKPAHLWGGSALPIERLSPTLDVYRARSYDELADSPVLYSLPDTATYSIEGVDVLVHCAHAGTDTVAPAYAKELSKLTTTIAKFLPSMPVNRYAFLFYLWKGDRSKVSNPFAMGALEHNQSSFYFLGFQKRPLGLRDIAIHEFFHILVPLNLHSEEIDAFDFRTPKMSQHLWLYEGTTEYFATLAPLHDSTVKEESFKREIQQKLRDDSDLPEKFSLTTFSKNVLTEEYHEYYDKVYTYGAVNAFLLDIAIRDASGGKQGLLDVVLTLMKRFGPNTPFKDDELFDHIEKITSPKVRAYLDTYVKGTTRIPAAEMFAKIGWNYTAEKTKQEPGFGLKGDFSMVNGKPSLVLRPTSTENPVGVVEGDVVVAIGGMPMEDAMQSAEGRKMLASFRNPKLGDEMTLTVLRDGKEVELKGTATTLDVKEYHFIEIEAKPSPEQLALRRAVFYSNAKP
jgi:predicted metalloprotease with PDZ domain